MEKQIKNLKSKIQNSQSESGFTIVESLVAIVIVSILITVIAPVITLAVGNRVQAKRVELATQAARTYIDAVEAGTIEPPNQTVTLNEVDDNRNFVSQRTLFAGVATPSAAGGLPCRTNTAGNSYCSNSLNLSLYCIDLDGGGCSINSAKDLVVQAFRSVSPTTDDNQSVSPFSTAADRGYLLGVRVYRSDAFIDDAPILASTPENKRTQSTFSGGLGNRKTPLVEMTTEVVTNKTSFQDFCDRLGCQDAPADNQ